MKKHTIFIYLTLISLALALYNFSLIVANNYDRINEALKNCLVVSLIGISLIFFSTYIEKNKGKEIILPAFFLKLFPLIMLIIIVTHLSATSTGIINNGFGKGTELTWNSIYFVMTVGVIMLLLKLMKKIKEFKMTNCADAKP
jgi:hypothetical protein